ncbi:MAG TPA: hypothetical protein VFE18_03430 [Phenylobacterium sp.]|uniref:hypothetical protein n=1 Tax=Phenylobacterium sp. TaxID=1871053 RepID=UPI002D729107|nr:hypothetical protein [Phenylobacterium sp.]HZZ67203.1 hypothetical protein [Phenylobacterium sp.]
MNFRLSSSATVPLAGAAVSLAAGLLLGGALQPNLDAGDPRPAGPQMVASWTDGHSTGPFDPGMTLASYPTPAPDYVMGTDAKKAMAWPNERAAVSQPSSDVADDTADASATLALADDDTPAPAAAAQPTRASYPSLGGEAKSAPAATDTNVAVDDDTLPIDQG